MPEITGQVRASVPRRIYTLPLKISESYGGTGQPIAAWALCDAPVTVSALARLGLGGEPDVLAARDALMSLARENGWPCTLSTDIRWRGRGARRIPALMPRWPCSRSLLPGRRPGIRPPPAPAPRALLGLWATSRERHPYMF